MKRILLGGAVWIALSVCGGCSGPKRAPSPSEAGSRATESLVAVVPIRAVRKTLIRYCEQPGQITALEQTPLLAKISGYVRRVQVDLGDPVTGPVYDGQTLKQPGQVLIELDVPEYVTDLAQKEAGVQQAESEIRQAESAVKVAQAMQQSSLAAVEEARATIERAEADYDRWKSELARITDLAARQAVTDKLVDETQSKFRAAESARKEVAAKVKSAEALHLESAAIVEKSRADRDAATARLGVAIAQRERARALLDFAQIRAPFTGVVASRHVDTGHLVAASPTAGEPLLTIVRTEVVRIFVDVPEQDAVHVRDQAEATIRVPSLPSQQFTGQVARTTWILNQATRTLRTAIDVPNSDGRLRPGMYAHARLKVAERPEALVLPRAALMTAAGQISCWRIQKDGSLVRQPVQTGLEAGGEIEIVEGLTGDEQLIGVNPGAFREGQVVELRESSTQPAK